MPVKGPVGDDPRGEGRGGGRTDPRNSLRRVLRRAIAETRAARPASLILLHLSGWVRREVKEVRWVEGDCGGELVVVVVEGRAAGAHKTRLRTGCGKQSKQ